MPISFSRFYVFLYPIILVVAFFWVPELLLNLSYRLFSWDVGAGTRFQGIVVNIRMLIWFSAALFSSLLLIDYWCWISGRSGRGLNKPLLWTWIVKKIRRG